MRTSVVHLAEMGKSAQAEDGRGLAGGPGTRGIPVACWSAAHLGDGRALLSYETGHAACRSGRLRLELLTEREEAPQSGARQAQPSIVTSNAMVGALVAWLLHERLSTGRAEARMRDYDSYRRFPDGGEGMVVFIVMVVIETGSWGPFVLAEPRPP